MGVRPGRRLRHRNRGQTPASSSAPSTPSVPSTAPQRRPLAQPPDKSKSQKDDQDKRDQDKKDQDKKDQKDHELNDQGVFVFRKDVDEVLLHASVIDDRQRIVTTLDKSDFTVYEDNKPQNILSFHQEDIPVAMGIIIDNSGSMREKRNKVNQAALNLVRAEQS